MVCADGGVQHPRDSHQYGNSMVIYPMPEVSRGFVLVSDQSKARWGLVQMVDLPIILSGVRLSWRQFTEKVPVARLRWSSVSSVQRVSSRRLRTPQLSAGADRCKLPPPAKIIPKAAVQ